ncbi:MAG: hypothetical protein Q7R41_18540 [Phycisphaerales bacterium]|nr:hypothetical protein [Phycisphaerales bacterium]
MKRTLAGILLALVTATGTAVAQSRPDFTGIWISQAADISVLLLPGEEISLTPFGAERYRTLDQANSPSYKCLPYGPTRGLQSTNPYQIIQTPGVFAIITEHIDYRLIYTDGRKHPEDILDYPEWMGHSIGTWDGDTLLVDTIGMREETWLDTSGFEHSDKLRITERFQKTGPDALRLTVKIEDPVFYTKPFTYARNVRREKKDVRLMPARCADNERSLGDALPGMQGPEHKKPPTFPK